MILIIDNYDSFTYNLYQAVSMFTQVVKVIRNDAITINEIKQLNPHGIILSPGPGHPKDSGICVEVIRQLGKQIPILGVCLGHQAIAIAFGGSVIRAKEPLHGKDSLIYHDRTDLFKDVSMPFMAGRYHSLIVELSKLPLDLLINAKDTQNNIMALRHFSYPIYGVQFHPESILTPEGGRILKNFVGICNEV